MDGGRRNQSELAPLWRDMGRNAICRENEQPDQQYSSQL